MLSAFGWGLLLAVFAFFLSFFGEYLHIRLSKSHREDFMRNPISQIRRWYIVGGLALLLFIIVALDPGTKPLELHIGIDWFAMNRAEKNAALFGMIFMFPAYYFAVKTLHKMLTK